MMYPLNSLLLVLWQLSLGRGKQNMHVRQANCSLVRKHSIGGLLTNLFRLKVKYFWAVPHFFRSFPHELCQPTNDFYNFNVLKFFSEFDEAVMNEAENWKGLPLEARNETKNILRKDILERYLEIKNTGLNSLKV